MTSRQEAHARGFTLVELLVSMALLALVSAILFSLLSESQSIWLRSGKRIEAYREARVAFESISRDLGQAALHPYWDYDSANNPKDYVRRSELRFVSGPELLGTSASEPLRGITHSVFFQAPLGHTSRPDYQGLETMFNSCGYFIEFGDDAGYRPDFLASKIEPRRRFRLMQWVQPAEQWDLFASTSGNPGYSGRDWFSKHVTGATATNIHVLAENVIALVLLPRLPGTEDPDGTALAPDYTYDSAPSAWPPPDPQPETENRLPPFVQVTLVTLDEGSAARLDEIEADPVGYLGISSLFKDARDFEDDLQTLKDKLQENRLEYRVFQSAVQLKSR